MEAKVSLKRRDNSPTPGGDILEDIIEGTIYLFKTKFTTNGPKSQTVEVL
jgi:hypothetical protein